MPDGILLRRGAILLGAVMVCLLLSARLTATPATLVNTIVLALALTLDEHVAKGPAASAAALRGRFTANLLWSVTAAIIMTLLMGPPGL